jgi:hypothetical protein
MTTETRLEKMKRELRENQKRHEDGGKQGYQILSGESLKFFRPSKKTKGDNFDGYYDINIVPYEAGKIPTLDMPNMTGTMAYCVIFYQHRNVGPEKDGLMICLDRTYGKKCPVCDRRKELETEGATDDEFKKYFPSRRIAYNVLVTKPEVEKPKGVQIFSLSYPWGKNEYAKKFDEKAKSPKTLRLTGESCDLPIFYWQPDETGRTISFCAEANKSYIWSLTDVTMEIRDFSVEQYVEKAFCLEDLLTNKFVWNDGKVDWPATEEMMFAYYNGDVIEFGENENSGTVVYTGDDVPWDKQEEKQKEKSKEKTKEKQEEKLVNAESENNLKKLSGFDFSKIGKEKLLQIIKGYPELSEGIKNPESMDVEDLRWEIEFIVKP